jgi:hypothetical protein
MSAWIGGNHSVRTDVKKSVVLVPLQEFFQLSSGHSGAS